MIDKRLRELVNLLLYGGTFIGLCAAAITALSFEIAGKADHYFSYTLLVGAATAALYCGHRVIGLHKMEEIHSNERFSIIRKYKAHIWVYFILWSLLTLVFFFLRNDARLLFWILPGGLIGILYILPVFPGGKRLRDLGWGKIIFIGVSWGWLTAFVPFLYFLKASLFLSLLHGMERTLFIILLTIPFEIRDIHTDRAVGLENIAGKVGRSRIMISARLLTVSIVFLAAVSSFHYINPAYVMSMTLTSIITLLLLPRSYTSRDDYFFSGLMDGMMILALILFLAGRSLL